MYIFQDRSRARRRLSIGNDFRANVSETKSTINVIRGGWCWRYRRRELKKERERKNRAKSFASKLQSSARGGDRHSPIKKRKRGRRCRKLPRLFLIRYFAAMVDKGEREREKKSRKNGEIEFESEHRKNENTLGSKTRKGARDN